MKGTIPISFLLAGFAFCKNMQQILEHKVLCFRQWKSRDSGFFFTCCKPPHIKDFEAVNRTTTHCKLFSKSFLHARTLRKINISENRRTMANTTVFVLKCMPIFSQWLINGSLFFVQCLFLSLLSLRCHIMHDAVQSANRTRKSADGARKERIKPGKERAYVHKYENFERISISPPFTYPLYCYLVFPLSRWCSCQKLDNFKRQFWCRKWNSEFYSRSHARKASILDQPDTVHTMNHLYSQVEILLYVMRL